MVNFVAVCISWDAGVFFLLSWAWEISVPGRWSIPGFMTSEKPQNIRIKFSILHTNNWLPKTQRVLIPQWSVCYRFGQARQGTLLDNWPVCWVHVWRRIFQKETERLQKKMPKSQTICCPSVCRWLRLAWCRCIWLQYHACWRTGSSSILHHLPVHPCGGQPGCIQLVQTATELTRKPQFPHTKHTVWLDASLPVPPSPESAAYRSAAIPDGHI